MKSVAFKVLGLACALVAGAGNLSAANLQTLLDRSPFAPSGAAAAAAGPQAEQGTLEFRGMVTDGGGTSYSVFDTTANKGRWVREGDDSGPFKVKSYDSATSTLEIEQDGRATKLSLKRVTIQAGAPVSAMMAAPAPANGVVAPGGGDQKRAEPAAADARRLEAVAAEVRRRRALRNSGKPQQGQPATPVPAPAPAPADAAAPAPVITP